MLQYNTKRSALPLPEYGRGIQQMVDHALTIEDREERGHYARGIIDTICRLNPSQRTNPEWRAKLWDHLAIMSGFRLDIDYPVELTVGPEDLSSRPQPLQVVKNRVGKRCYGKNIDRMIEAVLAIDPESSEREELTMLLANHMKKLMLAENPQNATDRRIFADLAEMSEGHIRLNPEQVKLREYELLAPPAPAKKKKRRH